MFASVIIVASGKGERLKADKPKQFIELLGKPVLAYTIDAFNSCALINEIVVVTNEQYVSFVESEIVKKSGFKKVVAVVSGGKERQHSVFYGLHAVSKNADVVLVHDGVRPFVTGETIEAVANCALKSNACVVGVSVKDTIKRTDSSLTIKETVTRENLWQIQTPQGFKRELLFQAYEKAFEDGFLGTDDSVLVERLGVLVKLVSGSYDNIKITTPEDLDFANFILNKRGILNDKNCTVNFNL